MLLLQSLDTHIKTYFPSSYTPHNTPIWMMLAFVKYNLNLNGRENIAITRGQWLLREEGWPWRYLGIESTHYGVEQGLTRFALWLPQASHPLLAIFRITHGPQLRTSGHWSRLLRWLPARIERTVRWQALQFVGGMARKGLQSIRTSDRQQQHALAHLRLR